MILMAQTFFKLDTEQYFRPLVWRTLQLPGIKRSTGISTDSDCRAFPLGKLPKNTISRNYKITNKRLRSCAKELAQNVSL